MFAIKLEAVSKWGQMYVFKGKELGMDGKAYACAQATLKISTAEKFETEKEASEFRDWSQQFFKNKIEVFRI